MKNHPTQDQWMEYLYGEMPSPQRKSLEAHLKDCAPCQSKKAEFSGTMETLDAWQVDVPAKHSIASTRAWVQPVVKWAAAATLLVTTGFAAAKFSQPAVDLDALEAKVTAQMEENFKTKVQLPFEQRIQEESEAMAEEAVALMREKVEIEMAAKVAEITMRAQSDIELAMRDQIEQLEVRLARLHDDDRNKMTQAIKSFETQMVVQLRTMREDLERVALYADENIRSQQRQLVQLASFTQPQTTLDADTNEN